jgi:hypothetical protein
VNVLGIVVAIDDHTPHISDLSRKDLPPIAVEGITLDMRIRKYISSNAVVANEAAVGEGDCLLLLGFTVWFERRTDLPRLCREDNQGHTGTWHVWRKDDEHRIDDDLAFGKRAWKELKELRRWWCERKTCEAGAV